MAWISSCVDEWVSPRHITLYMGRRERGKGRVSETTPYGGGGGQDPGLEQESHKGSAMSGQREVCQKARPAWAGGPQVFRKPIPIWAGQDRSFRSLTSCGRDKAVSCCKEALYGHIYTGKGRLSDSTPHVGGAGQEVPLNVPLWAYILKVCHPTSLLWKIGSVVSLSRTQPRENKK